MSGDDGVSSRERLCGCAACRRLVPWGEGIPDGLGRTFSWVFAEGVVGRADVVPFSTAVDASLAEASLPLDACPR